MVDDRLGHVVEPDAVDGRENAGQQREQQAFHQGEVTLSGVLFAQVAFLEPSCESAQGDAERSDGNAGDQPAGAGLCEFLAERSHRPAA